MNIYQLFSEHQNLRVYGDTLADALRHAGEIPTNGHYDGNTGKIVDNDPIVIAKILGTVDTSQSMRGSHAYVSVVVETEDGRRVAIDGQMVGQLRPLPKPEAEET